MINKDCFPAHIRKNPDGSYENQSVREHCRNTADHARNALNSIGLGNTAFLAGLLHDMGKEKIEFKEYIQESVEKGEYSGKTINHSFAGTKFILNTYHDGNPERMFASELIAFAIGAHHGLFDIANADKNGFEYRVNKENIGFEEAESNFFRCCAEKKEIDNLFAKATDEIKVWIDGVCKIASEDEHSGEFEFLLGTTARLILSAVIDGDRTDTAQFMNCIKGNNTVNASDFWEKYLSFMENKLNTLTNDSAIANARRMISDKCRVFAENGTGIYRLSVPTGAGKTLSSLRFGLAHAKFNKKKRIIFTAPLISILEQNADIIKDYLGDDSNVLLHYSNLIAEDEDSDNLEEKELLKENWEAPVIITSLVQLLNTLFMGKTSSIRRMNALCDSVIIIDEVQTVPMKVLTMFNLAVRFLSSMCNVTFVLCSATQPYLEGAEHPILPDSNSKIEEIIPFDETIWDVFRRTKLKVTKTMTEDELLDFIQEILKENDSLLVVCNTKNEAQSLYQVLCTDDDIYCFQLSAAMCMMHRRETMDEMRDIMGRISGNLKRVVCISTQVIEAGVDISFSCVLRVAAGMDSVVQAAGRCNRNGEYDSVMPVYIVRLTGERLGNLREIREAQIATISLIEDYSADPSKYENDLASAKAIEGFYSRLYNNLKKGYQDYYSTEDGNTVYSLLSDNLKYYTYHNTRPVDTEYIMGQAFKLAGDCFQVFDEDTIDVIVPYKDGRDIICGLQSSKAIHDIRLAMKLLRRAKEYSISIYGNQKERLLRQGYIYPIMGGRVFALADGCYSMDMGLAPGSEKSDYLEVG